MKIAFYAPLKSPHHPVPSGDRLMARQLLRALSMAGHQVHVVSELRTFSATADVPQQLQADASAEIIRIERDWAQVGQPDVWFCYHPYYKSPDLIGPALCRKYGIAYITVESSYSRRRNIGGWVQTQEAVLHGMRQAAVNICLTERDRRGILDIEPEAICERLPPFIDVQPFLIHAPQPQPGHLVTVAMMRDGDKLSSYRALAASLMHLPNDDWRLSIIGDGPARPEVEACFAALPPDRCRFLGQLPQMEIAEHLSRAAIYVWPGHGEAYGLAYLEAQAVGLPVIAEEVAGVPEVVRHGETGLLTPAGDCRLFADAIQSLLNDDALRQKLAQGARNTVARHHSIEAAATRLDAILQTHV